MESDEKEVDVGYELKLQSRLDEFGDFEKNIKNYVPLETIEIAKSLFAKYSKGQQYVSSKELITLLRLMNLNPSEKEVENMLKNLTESLDPEETKTQIEFYDFLICVARKKRESDSIGELVASFKLLDKAGLGKIPEPVLRFSLCKKGEAFTNEEMDSFLKEAAQFITVENDVKYLNYLDYALFLKDMYVPKEEIDPKKKGGKGGKGK